jgi:hypothetical protein
MYPQPYQPDSDGDGVPDACDNSFLLNGIPWEKEKLTESGTFVLESKQPGKGAVERVPLPTCDPDRDGWFSQGARQRLVFGNPEGVRLGAWVTDETGRSVANPKMAGNEIVLEFRPWGGREYFLNFIQPAEQTGGFNVELLLSCYVKDLPAGSIITPVPFNPDVVSTLVPLTLTAHVPTLTFTPTLTLTPTLTYTPTLTLTATPTNTSTPRPWPTWTNTFTPTLEPPVTNDCGQYTTRDTCLANPACTWIDFAAMSACVNK